MLFVVTSSSRRLLITLVKAGVSLALLAFLFSRVDVPRLWHLARSASIPWLAAALALYYLMICVSAWRWGVLLDAQGLRFPLRRLTSSFFVATFFNNFLPSNIGGDVVRIADTAPAAGSRTKAATVVLIDRGMGLLGLALIAAIGARIITRSPSGSSLMAATIWSIDWRVIGRSHCGQCGRPIDEKRSRR